METLKKIGLILLKILIGIVLLVVVYFFIAFILALIPVNSDFKQQENGTAIYVCSNGVHTDIVVPSQSGSINWNHFLKLDNSYKYVAFGWGEKDFYMNTPTWADLKFWTAFKAAFLFNHGVLQIYGFSAKLKETKNTIKINLTKEQMNQLNDYIYDSFIFDDLKVPKQVMPTKISDPDILYYEATRKYSIFFTCNNWTSKGLKRAGVKNSVWAPFDRSVLFYLR